MVTRSQALKKDQILSNLATIRQRILAAISALSETEADRVFLGTWSAKDLVAHLIGWDETNLEAARSILEGKLPSFYEHRDRDWQTYNAMLVRRYSKESVKELLAAMQDSQERLVGFLRTVPPEHFSRDFGVRFRGYKVTIQRLLEAEWKDEQTHLQQIADFIQESR